MPTKQPSSHTTATLPVIGMSCAACQSHVERALRQTPGVDTAEVNLMTHTARVVFDPDVTQLQNLVDAVKDSGYDSSLPLPRGTEEAAVGHMHDTSTDANHLRLRSFVTLGMAALAMFLSMRLMHSSSGTLGHISHLLMAILPAVFYRAPPLAIESTLLAMTLAAIVLSFSEVYRPAWNAALHRTTNMNTLVALGTIAALIYSIVATVAPGYFTAHGMTADVYYESVLFILAFLLVGRWLEARARLRTLDALQAFVSLQPQTVRLLRQDHEVEVPLSSVTAGDVVVARPGERLGVDGVVLQGHSSVDESVLTGESVPVPRGPGDSVIGGSINYDGSIEYRATSLGSESVLGRMLHLMEEAQSSRAPTQQLADRVSAVFVPVVLAIAALTFTAWMALDHANFAHAFAAAVTVLVIACPCALGLAVPAALTVAIGRGAQLGVLFKNGESLERLAAVDTIVLDKTGTLTEGRPRITGAYTVDGTTEEELLRFAASLEKRSEHPLARAVLDRAADAGLTTSEVTNLYAVPGKGITGIVDGHEIAAGNAALFAQLSLEIPASSDSPAGSTLLVAIDGQYRGYLIAQDQLRSGAAEAIVQFQRRGLRTIMLTGDNLVTAKAIAGQTGIDEFQAGLLPEQKLQAIQTLQAAGRKVAMAGDGINDAAALARADAGIAMGTGTDLAREAGGTVLLRSEPLSIVSALDLARATVRTMHVNLFWALGYNLLGIPIAAGILYPFFGILLSPAIASAAMALSSVSVLANSLRLRTKTA